jgi:hypothetical protein
MIDIDLDDYTTMISVAGGKNLEGERDYLSDHAGAFSEGSDHCRIWR